MAAKARGKMRDEDATNDVGKAKKKKFVKKIKK